MTQDSDGFEIVERMGHASARSCKRMADDMTFSVHTTKRSKGGKTVAFRIGIILMDKARLRHSDKVVVKVDRINRMGLICLADETNTQNSYTLSGRTGTDKNCGRIQITQHGTLLPESCPTTVCDNVVVSRGSIMFAFPDEARFPSDALTPLQ